MDKHLDEAWGEMAERYEEAKDTFFISAEDLDLTPLTETELLATVDEFLDYYYGTETG